LDKPFFRVIERTEVSLTRPALEQAKWTCQNCSARDDLRVVQYFHDRSVRVLCDRCRRLTGWPRSRSS